MISYTVALTSRASKVTPPILPPGPPPLLPPRAIKRLLAQLRIDRIMRLAHPRPEFRARTDSGRILAHPILEVFGADPAWVQLAKRGKKGLGLGL